MNAAFAAAQLADGLTMRPDHELNTLALALGDAALLAKVLLIVAVIAVAFVLADTRYRWVRPVLLGVGTLVGAFGAWSNVG